jgi:Tol biopolymer transport system component/predicted Ser/Thr protein kinase
MTGQTISHYQILEKLGEGGMGVVYKARDTTLDRSVALKFLPAQLAPSEQDKARFIQEARAAAALSHPNICTVYAIEEFDGKLFIAMDFVEGQTLKERPPISQRQAIEIGIQIADGLAAAHEKGIIHRDIKPENIMVRKDGIVQIMDFGLAKLRSVAGASRLTKAGSTIGTIGYMSPEQVQGQDVDHRTDIFSLGVLLYELFTGKSPYRGAHETAILYEIVNEDPAPMSTVKSDVPPELDGIVLECIAKEPAERYQSVAEVGKELRRFKRESTRARATRTIATRQFPTPVEGMTAPQTQPARSWMHILWPALTLVLTIAVVLLAWSPWRMASTERATVMRFPINLPISSPLVGGASTVAIAPDGKNFVYLGLSGGLPRLFLRPIDRLTAQAMAGTEGAADPFFSPDGKWIAFFAAGKLKKVSIFGGSPQEVCTVPGFMRGGWWNTDDVIWFGHLNSVVYRVSANGGTPTEATVMDTARGEISHRFPQPLPDGKTIIFTVKFNNITSFDDAVIAAENTVTHERRVLIRGGSYGRYVPTGHILFARGSSIYAAPFDQSSLAVTGSPLPVEEGGMLNPLSGDANYSVADNGTLVYAPLGSFSGLDASLMWMDRQGKVTPLLDTSRAYAEGALSPDGQKLAMTIRAANDDIWVYQLNRGTLTRITFGGGNSALPVWTPDGKRVVYLSERGRTVKLFSKPWDGSGSETMVGQSLDLDPTSFASLSPDNSVVAAGFGEDVWIVPLDSSKQPEKIISSPATEGNPAFSPDGHWLAYISNESGQNEVYVVPFPHHEGKYQISTNGAYWARWLPNGKSLMYLSGWSVMEVDVTLSPTFDFSPPRKVLELPRSWNGFWDVTADGKRFVIAASKTGGVQLSQVNIVVGWFQELTKKFATTAN